jgi:hypothetical protein
VVVVVAVAQVVSPCLVAVALHKQQCIVAKSTEYPYKEPLDV